MARKWVLALVVALAVVTPISCAPSDSNEDLGLEKAFEACSQDSATGGSLSTIAALAAEAAALDARWRPLADYAGSLEAADDLVTRLNEQGRDPNDSERDLLTQASADGTKLLTECEAVEALVNGG